MKSKYCKSLFGIALLTAMTSMAHGADRPARRNKPLFSTRMAFTAPVADVDISPLASLGADARFALGRVLLEFGTGLSLPVLLLKPLSYAGLYTELGASYVLHESSVAVYFGGGTLLRFLLYSSGLTFNMAPYLQFGATLTRESPVRFYADIRLAQNVFPLNPSQDAPLLYPTELGLQLGVGI